MSYVSYFLLCDDLNERFANAGRAIAEVNHQTTGVRAEELELDFNRNVAVRGLDGLKLGD